MKIGDKVRLKRDIDEHNLRGLIHMGFKMDEIYTVNNSSMLGIYGFKEIGWKLSIAWIELAYQKTVGFIIE